MHLPVVPVPSVIHIVSALLAMLLTDVSSKIGLDLSSSGKIHLALTSWSGYVATLTVVTWQSLAHPVSMPGTLETCHSIDVLYIPISP